MGAAGSKADGDPGIITVVPAAPPGSRGPSPLPPAGSSRPGSSLSIRPDTPCDPLLQHLRDLKAQGAHLDPSLFAVVPGRSSSSITGRRSVAPAALPTADPDSLLADLAVAQQVSSDTQALNNAITTLVSDYQSWHGEHMQALTQNQDYITRTVDQAEAKAERAVRHVQQQTTRLRQLVLGLYKASQLPLLLQQLTAATEALESHLQHLEHRADAVLTAAAADAAASGGSSAVRSSSSAPGKVASKGSISTGNSSSSSSSRPGGSFRSWLGGGVASQPQPSDTAPPAATPQQQSQQAEAVHQQQQDQQQHQQQQDRELSKQQQQLKGKPDEARPDHQSTAQAQQTIQAQRTVQQEEIHTATPTASTGTARVDAAAATTL